MPGGASRWLVRCFASDQDAFLNKRLELSALRKGSQVFPIELGISRLELSDRQLEFSAFVRARHQAQALIGLATAHEPVGRTAG
jgi:hypothetical protein